MALLSTSYLLALGAISSFNHGPTLVLEMNVDMVVERLAIPKNALYLGFGPGNLDDSCRELFVPQQILHTILADHMLNCVT